MDDAVDECCSFCFRSEREAATLVVGPQGGAAICDVCVELARDVVGERRIRVKPMPDTNKQGDSDEV